MRAESKEVPELLDRTIPFTEYPRGARPAAGAKCPITPPLFRDGFAKGRSGVKLPRRPATSTLAEGSQK